MAVIDATEFGAFAKQYAELRGQDLEKTSRGFFIQVSTNIILSTPVGDPSYWKSKPPAGYVGGRLRNNWFASTMSPSTETTKTRGAKGSAAIKRVNEAARSHKVGQDMYLTNNLPYVRRVEFEGWSRQAVGGMVRINLAKAEKALKEAVNNLNKGA